MRTLGAYIAVLVSLYTKIYVQAGPLPIWSKAVVFAK